jgi:hypothetical protein
VISKWLPQKSLRMVKFASEKPTRRAEKDARIANFVASK